MTFQIHALSPEPFRELFNLSDAELRARNAQRALVTAKPGFPCRVSLEDADVGETVILLHYEHLPVDSPYRASHAIYVREGVEQTVPLPGEIPEVLRCRLLSVRAFDAEHQMVGADVVEGARLEEVIERQLRDARAHYLHVHNAKPGCYAARVTRA